MCSLIVLNFGTLKDGIVAQSHTKFGANPSNSHYELLMIICIKKANLLSRLQGKPLMGIT